MTTETIFQAASISKPVAALTALRLVQEGRLKLDEDANRSLVSWKVPENEFTKQKKITLRQLLAHTSGYQFTAFKASPPAHNTPRFCRLRRRAAANSAPVRVEALPETRWRYSGGGYSVMEQLLIDAVGSLYRNYTRRKFAPVKMTYSNFEQPLSPKLKTNVASGHLANGEKVEGGWKVYPTLAAAGSGRRLRI